MNSKMEVLPPYRIAYIRRVGPYGVANQQTMQDLKRWAGENNFLDDNSILLGIAWDNPAEVKPENCRYDTCLVIPENYRVNGNSVNVGDLSGGEYAVFQITHTAQAVQEAWHEIYSELQNQEIPIDETKPILERYRVELVRRHYCEICVPIK